VCIVAAVGTRCRCVRNRTVLAGLGRDPANRSPRGSRSGRPNPHTKHLSRRRRLQPRLLDGMTWAASSGAPARELQADFSKPAGAEHPTSRRTARIGARRRVRHFDAADRDRLFGRPPATVWETFDGLDRCPGRAAGPAGRRGVLARGSSPRTAPHAPAVADRADRPGDSEKCRIVHACVRLQGETGSMPAADHYPGAQGRAAARPT